MCVEHLRRLQGLLSRSKLGTHVAYGRRVSFKGAGVLEDRAAGHEHVDSRLGHLLDVLLRHAAVNLQADVCIGMTRRAVARKGSELVATCQAAS